MSKIEIIQLAPNVTCFKRETGINAAAKRSRQFRQLPIVNEFGYTRVLIVKTPA